MVTFGYVKIIEFDPKLEWTRYAHLSIFKTNNFETHWSGNCEVWRHYFQIVCRLNGISFLLYLIQTAHYSRVLWQLIILSSVYQIVRIWADIYTRIGGNVERDFLEISYFPNILLNFPHSIFSKDGCHIFVKIIKYFIF